MAIVGLCRSANSFQHGLEQCPNRGITTWDCNRFVKSFPDSLPMMYVALSYDHRIIDGREAVTFLKRIKECIENPERIMVEV